MNALQRHALLWPSAQAWPSLMNYALQNQSLPTILEQGQIRHYLNLWAERDWPLVVARQNSVAMQDGLIALGLSLPPLADGSKPRLSLQIALDQVQRIQPPLSLVQVLQLESAQPSSRLSLAGLAGFAAQELDLAAFDLRVYGSWSWQVLTGLPYVQASSDIDLLFTPKDQVQLQQASRWFELASQEWCLDGELVFSGAKAVAWREWQSVSMESGARVLVKDLYGASLQQAHQLLNSLAGTLPDTAVREAYARTME